MTDGENDWGSPADKMNGADEALLLRIVNRVALATNREEDDLEPLVRTIDIEALNSLVTTSKSPDLEISFSYEDCLVEIDCDGVVKVTRDSNEIG